MVGVSQNITRRRLTTAWQFGQAAPHEAYPEGGCRLACKFRLSGAKLGAITTWSVANGGFTDLSGQYCYATISFDNSTTIPASSYNFQLFPTNLRSFGSYFQRFRVRSLDLTAVPLVGTSQNGRGTLGYIRDTTYGMNQTTASVGASFLSAAFVDDQINSVSFPLWEETKLNAIPMQTANKDDPLFRTAGIVGGYGTTDGEVTLEALSQGLVAASLNVTAPTVSTYYADIFIELVVDLYGFSGISSAPLTSSLPAKTKIEAKSESKVEFKQTSGAEATSRDTSADGHYVLVKAEAAAEQKQGSLLRYLGGAVRGS